MSIKEELALKLKINEIITGFIKEEVFKKESVEYKLSYTVDKGVIKIETDNKIIAQEIALRVRGLEERLKSRGVIFHKLLI